MSLQTTTLQLVSLFTQAEYRSLLPPKKASYSPQRIFCPPPRKHLHLLESRHTGPASGSTWIGRQSKSCLWASETEPEDESSLFMCRVLGRAGQVGGRVQGDELWTFVRVQQPAAYCCVTLNSLLVFPSGVEPVSFRHQSGKYALWPFSPKRVWHFPTSCGRQAFVEVYLKKKKKKSVLTK